MRAVVTSTAEVEAAFEHKLDKTQVTVFRLDGHSFSKFTSHFTKPFDLKFTRAMEVTAQAAFTYLPFDLGYVGSDEITLCLFPRMSKKALVPDIVDLPFNGRVQKMTSLLSGFVSATFYSVFSKEHDLGSIEQVPHFDCRVFQLPTAEAAYAHVADRCHSVLANSSMMFAQTYFSAKRLHKVTFRDATQLVKDEKGIDFYSVVPGQVRVGTVITSKRVTCSKVMPNSETVTFSRRVPDLQHLGPAEIVALAEAAKVTEATEAALAMKAVVSGDDTAEDKALATNALDPNPDPFAALRDGVEAAEGEVLKHMQVFHAVQNSVVSSASASASASAFDSLSGPVSDEEFPARDNMEPFIVSGGSGCSGNGV